MHPLWESKTATRNWERVLIIDDDNPEESVKFDNDLRLMHQICSKQTKKNHVAVPFYRLS